MHMPTGITIFLESNGLPADLDWNRDDWALSGTDGMVLQVFRRLASHPDFDVSLLSGPSEPPKSLPAQHAPSFHAALDIARSKNDRFLLFIAKSNDAQIRGLQRPPTSITLVAWAQNTPSRPWMDAALRCTSFHRLIAVSNYQRAAFTHPIYHRSLTIHNFVDSQRWVRSRDPSDNPHFSYIGALRPSKGFHHLSAAWPAIKKRLPTARLFVCGSPKVYERDARLGPEGIAEADYEKRILQPLGGSRDSASSLGVEFLGALTKIKLRETMEQSIAVIVNPNGPGESTETFCVSAIEAQAMGIPVVGGHAGALPEVIGHRAGGLLSRTDSALADAIVRLADSPRLRSQLADRGHSRVKAYFEQDIVMKRWIDFFKERPLSPNAPVDREATPSHFWIRKLIRTYLSVSFRTSNSFFQFLQL